MTSEWCFVNFAKQFSTKCGVVRDKNAKGCFPCNDKIIIEGKARVVLSIGKLLVNWGKACISFICVLKGVEKFSMWLRRGFGVDKIEQFQDHQE